MQTTDIHSSRSSVSLRARAPQCQPSKVIPFATAEWTLTETGTTIEKGSIRLFTVWQIILIRQLYSRLLLHINPANSTSHIFATTFFLYFSPSSTSRAPPACVSVLPLLVHLVFSFLVLWSVWQPTHRAHLFRSNVSVTSETSGRRQLNKSTRWCHGESVRSTISLLFFLFFFFFGSSFLALVVAFTCFICRVILGWIVEMVSLSTVAPVKNATNCQRNSIHGGRRSPCVHEC